MSKIERLNSFFSIEKGNKEKYDEIKENFIDMNEDLFQKKVYPDLNKGVENGTFLGMQISNEIFHFYFLNEDNTKIVIKSLQGGNTKEDYKRYQEQVMELGRS